MPTISPLQDEYPELQLSPGPNRCGCVCRSCAPGSVLCPTDNVCVNEQQWCDGFQVGNVVVIL